MSRELGIAMVAIVVLAGAIGGTALAGVGDGPALQDGNETNETATDGNESNATVDASALPPGVSESGVDDASALVSAHVDALGATGYSFEFRQNHSVEGAENESVPIALADTSSVQNGTVAAGLSSFQVHTESQRSTANRTQSSVVDYWGNETVVAVRAEQGEQTQYRTFQRTTNDSNATGQALGRPSFDSVMTKSSILTGVLQSGSFEVASTEETEDGTLVTLRATEYNASLGVDPENVTDYEATVTVDESGLVHELDFRLASTNREFPVELRYEFEVTETGDVNVTQPAWVPEAFESAGAQVSIGTENQTYLTVTNAGDRSIQPGATVVLAQDGSEQTVELTRAVPPEQTVYVAVVDGDATVGYGAPPEADGESLSGSYDVAVETAAGQTAGQASFTFGNATATGNATDDATAGNDTETNATGNGTGA